MAKAPKVGAFVLQMHMIYKIYMQRNYKKYIFVLISVLVVLGVGLGAGYVWGFHNEQQIFDKKINGIKPLRNNNTSYKFVDPLLFYMIPSADQQWGLTEMKNQVQGIINHDKEYNGLSDASIFFQDLNQGRWMGINQNDQYNPASMLKVVIMVSYFKEAENNPALLNQSFIYTADMQNLINEDVYNSSSNLVIGNEYTVEDLIQRMIVDSDNGAAELLLNNISQSSLDSVYAALDIPSPDSAKGAFTISPRYYSFFFRILYSATYLGPEYSEKALDILSDATFKNGIVSGIPNGTVVSHKYGEYVLQNNSQGQQLELHDCGIVYYAKNPYLLCIMTRGNNLTNLENTIKNISSTVYKDYSPAK